MDPTEKQTSQKSFGDVHNVVAEALSFAKRAEELKGEAIKQLLEQRTQIDADLKTLGYVGHASNGHLAAMPNDFNKHTPTTSNSTRRFREMRLADVSRVLIRENGKPLHGTEIERLAKAGGFPGGANNFQNYLPVALKRDGGFKNVGGNTWDVVDSA